MRKRNKNPLDECPDYTIVELPEKLIPDIRPPSRKLQPYETLTDSGKRKRIERCVESIATIVGHLKTEMDCPVSNYELIGKLAAKLLPPMYGDMGNPIENEDPVSHNPVSFLGRGELPQESQLPFLPIRFIGKLVLLNFFRRSP